MTGRMIAASGRSMAIRNAGKHWRLMGAFLALLEGAVVLSLFALSVTPAAAQAKDDRYPFLERRQRLWQAPQFDPFGGFPQFNDPFQRQKGLPGERSQTGDASKAPAARRIDIPPTVTVTVIGDSIADWLAYGLEEAFSDNPDIGVVRKIRNPSGLIRNDQRGEDWPVSVRQLTGNDKPDYLVVMMGLSDRQTIRERAGSRTPARASANQAATPPPAPLPDEGQPASPDQPAPAAPEAPGTPTAQEFRSEKWIELYSKRVDDMIAALKSHGVPVLWVGLPTVRGTRSKNEIIFLNDLYRGRAEKAGITYVDVWDGFVDEDGNYTQHGPDYEGQTRRLRSGDGVHFTKAGALKLAHYVQREIERLMASRSSPVALPSPEQPQTPAAPGEPAARPVAGPVVPLTGANANAVEELVGAGTSRGVTSDPVAARVLFRGESLQPMPGRADDFSWPRIDAAADVNEVLPVAPQIPAAIVRAPAQKSAAPTDGRTQKRAGPTAASAPARQVR